MTTPAPLRTLCAAAIALLPVALGAQPKEPGDLWEVQNQMSMPGMPMAMPAQSSRVCVPRNGDKLPVSGTSEDCTVSDVRRSGNTHSWKMRCSGPPVTTGTGEMTYAGRDAYRGTMTIESEGEKMTMTLSGRRVGDCDYAQTRAAQQQVLADAKKMETQNQAMVKDICARHMQTMDATSVKNSASLCGDQRRTFCSRAVTAEGFGLVARQPQYNRDEAEKFCGISLSSTRTSLCRTAEQKEDLPFLTAHCVVRPEAEPTAQVFGQGIFKRECAGRSFTGQPAGRYGAFCAAAVASFGNEAQRRAAATTDDAPAPTKTEDAIKKGTDLLRGILGR